MGLERKNSFGRQLRPLRTGGRSSHLGEGLGGPGLEVPPLRRPHEVDAIGAPLGTAKVVAKSVEISGLTQILRHQRQANDAAIRSNDCRFGHSHAPPVGNNTQLPCLLLAASTYSASNDVERRRSSVAQMLSRRRGG